MEANTLFKNKVQERLNSDNINYVVYGEINKSKNTLIDLANVDTKMACVSIVTVIDRTMVIVNLDGEASLNKLTKINLDDVAKIKFKSCVFGIGRKMTLTMKDGNCLQITFIKKVIGMSDQKSSLKHMEEELRTKINNNEA